MSACRQKPGGGKATPRLRGGSTGLALLVTAAIVLATRGARADALDAPLAQIARAGSQGSGSNEARAACDALSQAGPELLPRLLRAMDTGNPVAANWYRQAFDAIVASTFPEHARDFPRDELRAFVNDRSHAGRVRRLALALCDRLEPGFSQALVPRLLDDPEFREDAVDAALAAARRL